MPNISNTTEISFELLSLIIASEKKYRENEAKWEKKYIENEAKLEKKYVENEAKLRENIELLNDQNRKLNIKIEVIKTKINLWLSLQPETVRKSVS